VTNEEIGDKYYEKLEGLIKKHELEKVNSPPPEGK
jgi:hypothetical protein